MNNKDPMLVNTGNQQKKTNKLYALEQSSSVYKLLESLSSPFINEFWHQSTRVNPQGLKNIYNAIIDKNKDSQCPISNAAYSAVAVFEEEVKQPFTFNSDFQRDPMNWFMANSMSFFSDQLKIQKETPKNKKYRIHSGANIDPPSKALMGSIQHRNCAEKIAVQSAYKHDNQNINNLKYLFLYRREKQFGVYAAEKLLPCSDCQSKYFDQLIRNDGKLIIFLNNNFPRNFFREDTPFYTSSLIDTLTINPNQSIYYRIFSATDIPYLKVEEILGSSHL